MHADDIAYTAELMATLACLVKEASGEVQAIEKRAAAPAVPDAGVVPGAITGGIGGAAIGGIGNMFLQRYLNRDRKGAQDNDWIKHFLVGGAAGGAVGAGVGGLMGLDKLAPNDNPEYRETLSGQKFHAKDIDAVTRAADLVRSNQTDLLGKLAINPNYSAIPSLAVMLNRGFKYSKPTNSLGNAIPAAERPGFMTGVGRGAWGASVIEGVNAWANANRYYENLSLLNRMRAQTPPAAPPPQQP